MSLPATFHFAQALLCGYTGWQSYQAIWRLQGYEEQSEKAAQYSNAAAEQLHTTRTTQASGAVTTLVSFGCSLYLTIPSSASQPKIALALCFVNAVGLSIAYQHISSFWEHKAKVPLVKSYNEAIQISNIMRQYLIALGLSWWAAGGLYYFPRALGLM